MAFKKWQKSASRTPPPKSWQPEEMKIIGWCMSRGIHISISPDWKDEFNRWQIDIKIKNGKTHTDPNRYEDNNIYEKLMEYYRYYYKPNTNNN
mgnify:FL=1